MLEPGQNGCKRVFCRPERHSSRAGKYPYRTGKHSSRAGKHLFRPGKHLFRLGKYPSRAGKYPYRAGKMPYRAGKMPYRAGKHSFRAGKMPFRAGRHLFRAGKVPSRAGKGTPKHLTAPSSATEAGGTRVKKQKSSPPASVRWSAWLGPRLQSGRTWTDMDSGGGMRALPPERDERRNRRTERKGVLTGRTGTRSTAKEREPACLSPTENEWIRA